MRAGQLVAVAGVSLVIVGVVTHSNAQSSSSSGASPTGQLRQVAYLKASNAAAGAHFGCGGVLDGHSGNAAAISDDGSTMAVGAPHESSTVKEINGTQDDSSLYDSGAVYALS